MPSGEVHYHLYRSMMPFAILIGGVAMFYSIITGLGFIIGYLILGRYLDPDLDQVSILSAEGRMMRELGIFGALLAGYFVPYAYMMRWAGGHRSFLTHFPFVSTFIRLLYLLLPGFIILIILGITDLPSYFWNGLLGIWLGLSYADTMHWTQDLWKK